MPTNRNTTDPYKIATGKLFKQWRESNSLSQQNLHDICEDYGIRLFNSQFSHFEQIRLEPKTEFFGRLGQLMDIFLVGDFSKIKDQKLKSKLLLRKPKPVCYDWDRGGLSRAWTLPCDWFGCFVGQHSPPEKYLLPTEEMAKKFSDQCLDVFEKGWKRNKDQRIAKRNNWEKINDCFSSFSQLNKSLIRKIGDVLLGVADFTPEDLKDINQAGLLNAIEFFNKKDKKDVKKIFEDIRK